MTIPVLIYPTIQCLLQGNISFISTNFMPPYFRNLCYLRGKCLAWWFRHQYPILEYLGSYPVSTSRFQLPVNNADAGKQQVLGFSSWVPVSCIGDLDSWIEFLAPSLSCSRHLESELANGRTLFFQIKKQKLWKVFVISEAYHKFC